MFVTRQKDIIVGLFQVGVSAGRVALGYPLIGTLVALETKQNILDYVYTHIVDLHLKIQET